MKNEKDNLLFSLLASITVSCNKQTETDANIPFIGSKNYSWSGDKALIEQLATFYTKTKNEQELVANILIQKSNQNTGGNFDESTNINTYIKCDSLANISITTNSGIAYSLQKYPNGVFKIRNTQKDISNLYGRYVKIAADKGLVLRNDTTYSWSTNMYIPQSLQVTCFNEQETIISKNSGKLITWVADANNNESKGVIIRIRYDPLYE
ncbi:MAG: hypothetical protein HC831_21475 [Chloroflexia bacterium]|nr:hypothetical protein [Chloroflexia bacterium]